MLILGYTCDLLILLTDGFKSNINWTSDQLLGLHVLFSIQLVVLLTDMSESLKIHWTEWS